jgi:hypothetical protein
MAEDPDETPRPARRRPAVLSLAVMAVSVYLLAAMREETAYFFEPRVPIDFRGGPAGVRRLHNRHARVLGIPDRTRTVLIDGRFGHHRAIFRIHGTRSKLFVAQPRKHRMPPDHYSDEFSGRLLRMADQPYFPHVYRYFADHIRTPVDLPVPDLMRVAGRTPAEVRGGDGAALRLEGQDEIFVSVTFPGETRVQFDRQRYPRAEESDAIAASLGLPWGPLEDSRAFRSYVVRAGEADEASLTERFSDPVGKIGVLPRAAAIRCRWADVRVDGGVLVLKSASGPAPSAFVASSDGHLVAEPPQPVLRVEPERVRSAEVQVPLLIPMDAMILREGDDPGVYWYVILADVVLLALITFNATLLLRRPRPGGAGATP